MARKRVFVVTGVGDYWGARVAAQAGATNQTCT